MPDSRRQPVRVGEPVSVGAVMFRFALMGFVALIIVSLATAWVSRRVGTDQAIDDAERVAWISAQGIVAPALADAVMDLDADALDAVDDAVREYVLRGSLVRVKVWDAEGTIVYSDEPRLIGEKFELSEDNKRCSIPAIVTRRYPTSTMWRTGSSLGRNCSRSISRLPLSKELRCSSSPTSCIAASQMSDDDYGVSSRQLQ